MSKPIAPTLFFGLEGAKKEKRLEYEYSNLRKLNPKTHEVTKV